MKFSQVELRDLISNVFLVLSTTDGFGHFFALNGLYNSCRSEILDPTRRLWGRIWNLLLGGTAIVFDGHTAPVLLIKTCIFGINNMERHKFLQALSCLANRQDSATSEVRGRQESGEGLVPCSVCVQLLHLSLG
jgi:hypothetical protein